MGKQFYFYEMNSDAGNVLSEFFNSENLAFLFISLYRKVNKYIPDVVIRGIPGQIFGVSRLKERCLFYVTSSPDKSFIIHFKGDSGEMTFSKENAEKMAELAFCEAQRRKQNPGDYQIYGSQSPNGPENTDPASCSSGSSQAYDEIPDDISAESVGNDKSNDKSASILDTSGLSETEPGPEIDQTDHEKHTGISKLHTEIFTDKEIKCQDCGEIFVFTSGEQEFYNKKGFVYPKRCKLCREKKKQSFEEEKKYIGLGSITGKMGTKRSSYLEHAKIYGPSINVDGGLPNSPGFRRGREKNGTVEYTTKVGKKKITRKHHIDH